MNQTKRIVAAIAAFVMSLGMAQAQLSVTAGLSFPQGSFAENNAGSFALLNPNGTAGAAELGQAVNFKYQLALPVKGLSAMGMVEVMWNGISAERKADNNVGEVQHPTYLNAPIMVGLNYQLNLAKWLGLYIEAGLGLNTRLITNYQGSLSMLGSTPLQGTLTYDPAFSFAYQLGGGIKITEHWLLAANYYRLGVADVKGDATATVLGLDQEFSDLSMGTVDPGFLTLRIGYSF